MVEEHRQGKRAGAWLPVGGNVIAFPDGLEELPRALAARLGDSVRLRAPAARVVRDGDGVRVELQGGGAVEAAAAVLALPAPAAADLLEAVPSAATLLRQVAYAPLAVVHLGFSRAEVPADLEAFGFLVPSSEGLPVRGCIYTSSLFPGRAPPGHCLLSVVLGGARTPDLVVQPEDALIRLAASSVRRLLGVHQEPSFARAFAWPRALPQYEVGTERRNAALRAELARAGPFSLAGSSTGGVFLGDCARRAEAVAEAVTGRARRTTTRH
jgi:oxygen-dependent protoporphyrinogen oxidase